MKTSSSIPSDSLVRIGNLLRHKRLLKGDKLKKISSDIGISHGVVSRIENGRYNLSVSMLLKLCAYYGISSEEISEVMCSSDR